MIGNVLEPQLCLYFGPQSDDHQERFCSSDGISAERDQTDIKIPTVSHSGIMFLRPESGRQNGPPG
jgi:hypothetical protein